MKHNKVHLIYAVLLFALFSFNLQANEKVTLKQVQQYNLKEGKLNNAAVDVFFELRKEFGQRLRTAGGLIFCKKPDLAKEVQPSIFELMIASLTILDKTDLSIYGITNVNDKMKARIARRAVTAATVYVFSADEQSQTISKILPSHTKTICKTSLQSYNDIMSK